MATARLSRYQEMRDFSKTAEPSGSDKVVPSDRLRFVIQKHAASHLHFDLRLEYDGVFKSWAVPKGPSLDPSDRRLAMEVEDHPLTTATSKAQLRNGSTAAAPSCSGIEGTGPRRRVREGRPGAGQGRAKVRHGRRADAWLLGHRADQAQSRPSQLDADQASRRGCRPGQCRQPLSR